MIKQPVGRPILSDNDLIDTVSDICLVRQPVFDKTASAVGYEIRHRETGEGGEALARSCVSGALDVLRGGLPAWVYPSWHHVTNDTLEFVDPNSVCVMVPPDIASEVTHVDRVAALAQGGFSIVIDEFDGLEDPQSPQFAFVPFARIVRFDLRVNDVDAIAPLVNKLRAMGKQIAADHVADARMYEACRAAGFEFFQGMHFARPEPMPASELPTSTATALRVMAMARDLSVSDREIELAISTDPAIVLQLLRIVNSASVGGRGVTSIAHALRLAGREKLMRWLSLAAYASRSGTSGIADELTRQAVQRAFFAEALAVHSTGKNPGTAFLVGLFSLLDAVFRMPLADVLSRVNLSDDVRGALVDRTGQYAECLELIEAYELGLWESAAEAARQAGVEPGRLPPMYAAALQAAEEIVPARRH